MKQATNPKHQVRRGAFARGFWRGLAAPLMLYSGNALPAELRDYKFKPLEPMARGDVGSDWKRVGDALRGAACKSHGQ